MKIRLLLLAILVNLNLFGQTKFDKSKISKRTNNIVKKIKKVNSLKGAAVGYSGTKPKQWDNFDALNKNATTQELIELTSHENGVVRCYSFWALSYKKDVGLFSIVKKHLNDDKLIDTQFGCIGGPEMVGDFFIQVMTPLYIDMDSKKMDSNELAELDSLLIYQTNNLASKYAAIRRAEPTEELYPKIRELVLKENNQSALVTLAKYQKVQDVEIIKNNREKDSDPESGFHSTYLAISNFPRPEFIPLLEQNLKSTLDETHYSTEWRELYKAIASYKNEKALELLKIPFTQIQHKNIKKYHINFVYGAIQKCRDSIYDELYWKIWEEENKISIEVYKYLLSLNSSRAYELTKKEMRKDYIIEKSDFVPETKGIEFLENVDESMLDLLIKNDKEFAVSVIMDGIENSNVHDFSLYTSKINNEEVFVAPLLKRLETEWNAHVYIDLVKILIAFEDRELNQRVLKIRKRNKNLTDGWGGKLLSELLQKNGIE